MDLKREGNKERAIVFRFPTLFQVVFQSCSFFKVRNFFITTLIMLFPATKVRKKDEEKNEDFNYFSLRQKYQPQI